MAFEHGEVYSLCVVSCISLLEVWCWEAVEGIQCIGVEVDFSFLKENK